MNKISVFFTILFCLSTQAIAGEVSEISSQPTFINSVQAKTLKESGVTFIDSRKKTSWNLGHIPGAKHIDYTELTKQTLTQKVNKEDRVVFYCDGDYCDHATKASAKAIKWGYKNVYYMRDGYPGWRSSGYPVK